MMYRDGTVVNAQSKLWESGAVGQLMEAEPNRRGSHESGDDPRVHMQCRSYTERGGTCPLAWQLEPVRSQSPELLRFGRSNDDDRTEVK